MGLQIIRLSNHDVVHENEVGGSSIIWVFPLVIADSERDMLGIEPGPLGCYTSALTTGLQEVRQKIIMQPRASKIKTMVVAPLRVT